MRASRNIGDAQPTVEMPRDRPLPSQRSTLSAISNRPKSPAVENVISSSDSDESSGDAGFVVGSSGDAGDESSVSGTPLPPWRTIEEDDLVSGRMSLRNGTIAIFRFMDV